MGSFNDMFYIRFRRTLFTRGFEVVLGLWRLHLAGIFQWRAFDRDESSHLLPG